MLIYVVFAFMSIIINTEDTMGACQNQKDIITERRRNLRGRTLTKSKSKDSSMSEQNLKKYVLDYFNRYDTTGDGTLDKFALKNFF